MRTIWLMVAGGCASQPVVGDPSAPSGPRRAITADGEVTWTVTRDDRAKAAGREDCTFTRRYTAIEDRSTPWLCPACDVVLLATVEMSEDDRACYRSIAGEEPATEERIGWSTDRFFRAAHPFAPLRPAGAVDTEGGADARVTFAAEQPPATSDGGALVVVSAGELALGVTAADPWQGMWPPPTSACGWPRSGLDLSDGPWAIEIGRPLPDGWFEDVCGEPARLRDFFGNYLVVVVSAMDCGPCQAMAAEERAFLEQARSIAGGVEVITLLSPSLDAPLDPMPAEDIALWTASYELRSPVLGDRGWGFALSQTVWPDVMAYPSWFVTSPGLEVLAAGHGYDAFEGALDAIASHRSDH